MSLAPRRHGFYDHTGHWRPMKRCFAPCRDCTCKPPLGVYYRPDLDKTKTNDGNGGVGSKLS